MSRHSYTRRDFLKSVGLGAAAALAMPGCAGAARQFAGKGRNRPNILFFFTDDQRFDTIGALGNKDIITPNMDSLVREGTSFTNAYIMGSMSGAVCVPSRAMLMTGRTLFHLDGSGRNIPEKYTTLPEVLRKAGYTTFETGKWHQDKASFNRCFMTAKKIFFGGMSDHWHSPLYDFDPTGKYPKDRRYEGDKHDSELFSDAVIEFLRNYKSAEPFFAYVSYKAPHDPRQAPKEYLDMYDPEKIPLPKNFKSEHPFDNGDMKIRDERLAPWPRTPEVIRKHIRDYFAIITHLDAQIGRVMDALKETRGQAENTIIVFAGDNGLAVGRHGLMGKQNLYEHSIHVPLIMSGPGIPRGAGRDALCYFLDIFPTLCDLTGMSIPGSVEGKSLVPVIQGPKQKIRDSLFFAYKNFQRSVSTGRWKLILYNVKGKKATQLFDLQNDPWELTNLADDPAQASLIRKLRALMKNWIKKTGDKPDWGVSLIRS